MKKSKKMDKGNTLTVHNMDKNVSDRRKTDTRQYGERVEEIEAITGTYTNNYNICNIDKRIKNYIEQEKKEINNIDEEIERLDWIIENTEDKKEKTTAKNEKMQKIQRKEDIITNKRMNEYISKTKDYIDNYLLVLPPRSESVFGLKKKEQTVDHYREARLTIIARYLNIAKRYYPIKLLREEKHKYLCPLCQKEMEPCEIGVQCNVCATFMETLESTSSHRELYQSNSKILYERRKNFEDTIKSFSGKQTKPIPDSVYSVIDSSLKRYGIDKPNITKDIIYLILKEEKLSENYSDINLIHSVLTGIPPPNIDDFEISLLHRYDLFEEIYPDVKPEDRQNSLHNPYLLWAFLLMEGYKCKVEDFSTLKTRDVIIEHDEVMRRGCVILADKYPDINWKFRGLA